MAAIAETPWIVKFLWGPTLQNDAVFKKLQETAAIKTAIKVPTGQVLLST
jgi:hypothetical protein